MLIALVLALPTRSVFATADNPLDWNGSDFLILYIAMAGLCAIATFFWRRHLRDNGAGGNDVALDTWDIAYLAGGAERVMDCAVARLMRDKVVVWDAASKRLKMSVTTTLDDPLLERIARHLMIEGNPRKLARRLEPEFSRIRDRLAARGLLLEPAAKVRAAWLPSVLPALLLVIGAAKVMIGLSRGKPVAFLIILMIVIGIATLLTARSTSARSLAGDRALSALKKRHAHTARAPRPDDLPLAVALAGTAVLATTPYSAYHQFRQPSSGSNGDSSSGSSCSGGGSGCGGCGGGD